MNRKQFAYLYIFENGIVGMRPSYYGGYESIDKNVNRRDYCGGNMIDPLITAALSKIREVGIDWDASEDPYYDTISQFVGTDDPSEYIGYIWGKLVLKDGTAQQWLAQFDADGRADVFQLMADVATAPQRLEKLTGEQQFL